MTFTHMPYIPLSVILMFYIDLPPHRPVLKIWRVAAGDYSYKEKRIF